MHPVATYATCERRARRSARAIERNSGALPESLLARGAWVARRRGAYAEGRTVAVAQIFGPHADEVLRFVNAILAMGWKRQGNPEEQPSALVAHYNIHPEALTDCYVCHR